MSTDESKSQQSLTPIEQKLFQDNPELTTKNGNFDFNRARALFYQPAIIEKIIEARLAGNSPRQAFQQVGIHHSTFDEWKTKLSEEACPAPIKYLFAHIILDPKDERYIPDAPTIPFYYKPAVVNAILKYKRAGLSDGAAFKGAGIYVATYYKWRKQIKEDPACPKKLKNLFRDMAKAESKIMADVVSVVVEEAVENKNWKAALDLMPRLWRKEYGAHPIPEEPELSAPTFNLDELTSEEQETFIRLGKKCRLVDNTNEGGDSKVKLLISLPDNGR